MKIPLKWAPFLSLLAVIICRIIFIELYAVNIPLGDSWAIEGLKLYPKYLDGSLSWQDFFEPHNEHRILLTRLYLLSLFELGGHKWPLILSMKVQTLVPALTCFLFSNFYLKKVQNPSRLSLLGIALAFALPTGYESLLWNIEIHWYFLVIFSLLSFYSLQTIRNPYVKYIGAQFFAVLSFFSIASGFITSFVLATYYGLKLLTESTRLRNALLAISSLFITFLLFKLIPRVDHHGVMELDNLLHFPYRFFYLLGWPKFTAIYFFWFPVFALILKMKSLKKFFAEYPFLWGMVLWIMIQAAAMTMKRGGYANRYYDATLSIVPIAIIMIDLYGTTFFKRKVGRLIPLYLCVVFAFHGFKNMKRVNKMYSSYEKTYLEIFTLEKQAPGSGANVLKPSPHADPFASSIYPILVNPLLKDVWPTNIKPE